MAESTSENQTYVESVKKIYAQIIGDQDLTGATAEFYVYKPDVNGDWEEVVWVASIEEPPTAGLMYYSTLITPDFDLDYAGDYIIHPKVSYSGGAVSWCDPFILRVKARYQI